MRINDIPALPNIQAIIKRFEAKFARRGPDDCWEWHAALTTKGYGQSKIRYQNFLAHRVAYVLYKGPIPDGEGFHGTCLLHRCDNPLCINPAHMFFGTAGENCTDMAAKDRSMFGVRNSQAKLNDDKVRAIRRDPRPTEDIAPDYGVSSRTIRHIKNRDTWRRVG